MSHINEIPSSRMKALTRIMISALHFHSPPEGNIVLNVRCSWLWGPVRPSCILIVLCHEKTIRVLVVATTTQVSVQGAKGTLPPAEIV